MIHAFVVMKPTGEVLYAEKFETDVNVALLSGFFAALTQFGRALLKDEGLDTVELGKYRLFLESTRVEKEELIFAAVAARRANIAGIKPKLQQARNEFILTKSEQILHGEPGNLSQFEDFRSRLVEILHQKDIQLTPVQKNRLLGHFQRLYELSEYAIGAVLLTQSGEILQSFMEPADLEHITRLLEGRFLAGIKTLREIISVEDRGVLVIIGSGPFITAVMFQALCPLGTAELFARRFADRILAALK